MKLPNSKYLPGLVFLAALWILACGGAESGDQSNTDELAEARHPGQKVYNNYCITCHGYNGTMGANGAHNLKESTLTLEERIEVITNGRNTMTAFGKTLSEEQIQDVSEYIETLRG